MSEIKYIYILINILNGPKKQQNALLLFNLRQLIFKLNKNNLLQKKEGIDNQINYLNRKGLSPKLIRKELKKIMSKSRLPSLRVC